MDIQNEIKILLEKLETVLKLADEGLLKSERYYETKYAIEDQLKELYTARVSVVSREMRERRF